MRRLLLPLLAAGLLAQEGGPGGSRLDETNRKAAERVLKTMEREGGAITNRLRGLRKEDVIVVGGLFDFVQEVLVAYRCPHTVVSPRGLERVALDEPWRKVFLLNCHLVDREFPATQPAEEPADAAAADRRLEEVLEEAGLGGDQAPGRAIRERFQEVKLFAGSDYSRAGLARMGAAVKEGAWIYSTDWAVLAVEAALPGTVKWTGRTTFEEVVEVAPALAGRRHPLLEGVFGESGKARWWVETESYLFRMEGRQRLLVESLQLGARYGGNRAVVGLVEAGKGRVLHALSHGYLQQGKEDDVSAMQRLLLNYLVEKSVANHRGEGK